MSQQEFEPRQKDETHQAHDWSNQPRDASPGSYGEFSQPFGQDNYRDYQARPSRVPWWARPQPQSNVSRSLVGFMTLVVVIIVLMGALGIMGLILGALAHLLAIILGALFALFLFTLLLVLLLVGLIGRAIRRVTGYDRRAARRGMRRW